MIVNKTGKLLNKFSKKQIEGRIFFYLTILCIICNILSFQIYPNNFYISKINFVKSAMLNICGLNPYTLKNHPQFFLSDISPLQLEPNDSIIRSFPYDIQALKKHATQQISSRKGLCYFIWNTSRTNDSFIILKDGNDCLVFPKNGESHVDR